MRRIEFAPDSFADLIWWLQTDRKMAARLLRLIDETSRDPFTGIGKPEPLSHSQGAWSRRIDQKHRLVYRVADDRLFVISCREHYDD